MTLRRTIRQITFCSLATLALLTVPEAQAQPAPSDKEAPAAADDDAHKAALTEKYRLAQEHFHQKRYTEALPLFREVAAGLASPNAWLYVARCERALGRPAEAHRAMRTTAEMAAKQATDDPRFAATRDAARSELGELDGEVAHLRVVVDKPPPGLQVEVNGNPVAFGSDEALILNPGEARLLATAPGRETVRQTLQLGAGRHETVRLPEPTIIPTPEPGATAPSAPDPPGGTGTPSAPEPIPVMVSRGGGVRIFGTVVLGVAAVGWSSFGILGVLANQRYDEISSQCNHTRCTDPELADDITIGRALDIGANVGLAIGITGTVSGILLVAFGGPHEEPMLPKVGFAPSPGGGSMLFSQSF